MISSLYYVIEQSKYWRLIFLLVWFLKYLLPLSVSFAVGFGSASQVLLLCQGTRDGCIKDVCFQARSVGVCVYMCAPVCIGREDLYIRQNKARKIWLWGSNESIIQQTLLSTYMCQEPCRVEEATCSDLQELTDWWGRLDSRQMEAPSACGWAREGRGGWWEGGCMCVGESGCTQGMWGSRWHTWVPLWNSLPQQSLQAWFSV